MIYEILPSPKFCHLTTNGLYFFLLLQIFYLKEGKFKCSVLLLVVYRKYFFVAQKD